MADNMISTLVKSCAASILLLAGSVASAALVEVEIFIDTALTDFIFDDPDYIPDNGLPADLQAGWEFSFLFDEDAAAVSGVGAALLRSSSRTFLGNFERQAYTGGQAIVKESVVNLGGKQAILWNAADWPTITVDTGFPLHLSEGGGRYTFSLFGIGFSSSPPPAVGDPDFYSGMPLFAFEFRDIGSNVSYLGSRGGSGDGPCSSTTATVENITPVGCTYNGTTLVETDITGLRSSYSIVPVPAPPTMLLCALGGLGLWLQRRRLRPSSTRH